MMNSGEYNCVLTSPLYNGEAVVKIDTEGLLFQTERGDLLLNFAKVSDCRLLNYHLFLNTPDGKYELSQLGRDTENFFEKLWTAYDSRSRESLFVDTVPLMETEGEYSYADDGGNARGKAKLSIYPTCVCILPHNSGARRVPMCFMSGLKIDNYTISITLDTDERYELIRLGRNTVPFYEKLCVLRDEVLQKWTAQHDLLLSKLNIRLGNADERYGCLKDSCGNDGVIFGLFASDNTDFWISAFGNGVAAVELVTAEKSATYLYRISGDRPAFEKRLRHAMEAMGSHREIIFMDDGALMENPLYLMAAERNAHLRFLRGSMDGRAVHTDGWKKKIADYLLAGSV